MEILTKDFVEFIECCIAREVKFLIVGDYALAAHGHPRATKDLEVWILVERSNAERLMLALDDFAMESVGLQPDDFLEPEIVVQLGYPPVRIDLITSATGVDFEECWDNRITVSVGQVEAGFISQADLIANKRASARPQDLVDVEVLETGRSSREQSRDPLRWFDLCDRLAVAQSVRRSIHRQRDGDAKQPRKRVVADVLILDDQDQILLVDPNCEPDWDLPGGMVEANELHTSQSGAALSAWPAYRAQVTSSQCRL